jgi:hypothetical protein
LWLAGIAIGFVAGACSSTTTIVAAQGDSGAGVDDASAGDDAGDDSAPPVDKLSWTYIYGTYFGPGTLGHCGNAGCHATVLHGFVCASQKGCYSSLVNSGWISQSAPTTSAIGDPTASILAWYGNGGTMPQDAIRKNATAGSEVTAWVAAGAKND